ncbi:uncharacterized protein LOC124274942, partial [Haliotis rubra]|uniref:uncharacterized protein LOC124274942 n=1 Tax=Haliotis rubra TaxID=36100 RepID=UPI001EE4F7B6
MDLQKIADFGESLGYTGKDLQLFVKEKIDIQLAKEQAEREREERANVREAKKFEQELEKAKLEREKEKERMEVEKARIEAEKEKASIEAEKEKVRLHVELEKEKAQLEMTERVELEKLKKENSMSEAPENSTPSLPVRIENYFTRWIELSGTEKTYDGVRDLLLREQILNSTGRDLSMFLRERTPKTAMEMAKLAEQFVEARGTGFSKFQNPLYSKSNKYVHQDRIKEKGYEDSRKVKNIDDKREPTKFVSINQRKCYACGEVGHIASRCSKHHTKGMKVASIYREESVDMVQDGLITEAQVDAHVEKDKIITDDNEGEVTSGTMCGMCGTMPICQGKVFDHAVQVLRDTGCSGVIVRKSLVDEQHFTSDTQTCVMADSRAVVIPVAWITIDTPFYRGTVKAACPETPLCDLILGNIPGVRAPDNPFPETTETVLAVETRGQKRVREEGKIPMKTIVSVGVSLSRNEFVEMQRQDESLNKVRKMAEENKVRNTTHDLTPEQKQEVSELVSEYQDVLTDLPGRTDSIEYKIKLTSTEPISSKPYPLPHHMREVVAREVESMLRMDVIEPSNSPYAAPVVLIKKPDETYRFCTDFRKLNQISVFDPEPIPLAEAVFSKLSKCKYLTKIDISKACWQVPMEERSKEYTAFITPDGLYQWKVMPFGVVNAPAVFSWLRRKVLKDIPNVDNYIDDILEGTEDWENHRSSLRMVFDHLRQHHLTARPSKVKIGYTHLEFLGHTVGEGQLALNSHNLDKILNLARPETKKQVRALIGLTGYYRKFIPNFAAIAAPLTDLTKKGIGGILLQEHENEKFPVMFVSRKLLKREKAYSTIEKECLAIVWAVQKLTRYLYEREFVLETDHQPLVWMSKAKLTNGRVMRWIELSGTFENLYDGVREISLLREQILNSTGERFEHVLRERTPKTAMEMAKLAEQFVEARGTGRDLM